MPEIDPSRLARLLSEEQATYTQRHHSSKALYDEATHLFGHVPMTWMNMWSGGFPLYFERATGNRIVDVDEHEYIDFALGDTGAMAGHSPPATVRAVERRINELGGITTMLPTAEAAWVGAELARRFGLPLWSFTLSATDANRWAIRLARLVTEKPKIVCFSYSYHGSVDETFAIAADGATISRPGNAGPPVALDVTTRAVAWNDLEALETALAHRDVAVILTEPALTNIGIVLPDPDFHAEMRALASRYGALLMIDETHTLSAGPGGATAAWGLRPDMLIIGKSIGGGIPSGAYGITADVAAAVEARTASGEADLIDVGGVGGTLAGNGLSVAAMRATLAEVLTDDAFEHMITLATRFTDGVRSVLTTYDVPWSITQLGARAEYRFTPQPPRDGESSAQAADPELDNYLHLALCNRGILMTPFHNMALMCPTTSTEDVDRHTAAFGEVVGALVSEGRPA
ncbi:MAG: transaminase [Nocardioidaceae bacterium]